MHKNVETGEMAQLLKYFLLFHSSKFISQNQGLVVHKDLKPLVQRI